MIVNVTNLQTVLDTEMEVLIITKYITQHTVTDSLSVPRFENNLDCALEMNSLFDECRNFTTLFQYFHKHKDQIPKFLIILCTLRISTTGCQTD